VPCGGPAGREAHDPGRGQTRRWPAGARLPAHRHHRARRDLRPAEPLGQTLGDTDWHVDRLYDGLLPGVTTVRANFHRYVIDANRDPSGASLYPGQNTTGLVPVTNFDGEPSMR
jgi:N-formylglutamate amidohydrolase